MKKIPFFSNLPDGTHCYQAALGMILACFTGKEIPFENLDRITGKLPGKWTWPTQSLIWLLDHHYEIRLTEPFSYEAFAKDGKAYLTEKWGSEVADAQESNSDLPRERHLAAIFSKRCRVDYRVPAWSDLSPLFKEGFLMICNINACLLYGRPGYSGHFVVPVSVSEREIVLHDPGLPPAEALPVPRPVFEKAWGYPTENEKNVLAIRPETR